MKTVCNKLLSLMLVAVLLVSAVPFQAFATEGETTAPVETEAPAETTAPVETEAPTETTAPVETEAPTATEPTTEPTPEKGCGGFSTYAIITVIVCGACLCKKWSVDSDQ